MMEAGGSAANRRFVLEESHQQVLRSLRLSEDIFHNYAELFVGHEFDYVSKGISDGAEFRAPSRWNRRLSGADVLRHLKGEEVFSTGCRYDATTKRHRTRLFAIDLDVRGESIESRYRKVCSVLDLPTLVFQSSESGGLHLYYLLDREVDLYALRSDDRRSGAVLVLLAEAGMPEQPGRVEVYPRGRTKRNGQQNRLRLPLGKGSILLEPRTLLPSSGNRLADVRDVSWQLEQDKLECISASELLDRAHQIGPWKLVRQFRRRSSPSKRESVDRLDVEALYEEGLSVPGERHEATRSLAFWLRAQGRTQEQAAAELRVWLERKHNGQSRTVSYRPKEAFRDLDDTVRWVFEQPWHDAYVPAPGLTGPECRIIFAATELDSACCDPRTGEAVSRLKLQRLLFHLLNGAKQWLLTYRLDSLGDAKSGLDGWPWSSFIVPMPYAHRIRVDGVSRRSQGAYWRAALETQLILPAKPSNVVRGTAATFKVSLDLRGDANVPVFAFLEDAAASLLTREEARQLYTRHYSGIIEKRRRELGSASRVADQARALAEISAQVTRATEPAGSAA